MPPENAFCLVISSQPQGFVDAHTHPVWSGDRVHEFAMKMAGASYMEIHKVGGGINYTVEHVRRSSEEELTTILLQRLDRMLRQGMSSIFFPRLEAVLSSFFFFLRVV